jgi:DnaJ-class molecular chaperone
MSKKLYAVLLCNVLFIGCASVDNAKKPEERKVVDCVECNGDGKVYYGPDHPIVKMGFDVGEYDCPMCGGSGELEE